MASGLAGFVVAGDGLDWDEVLDGVRAALAESFGIAPEYRDGMGRPRRRTWFDTFDWRLHRAGLLLEHIAAGRTGELVLASTDDDARDSVSNNSKMSDNSNRTPPATRQRRGAGEARRGAGEARSGVTAGAWSGVTQAVTGWRATGRHMADEIPGGPLADRIGALVQPRALLPAATVSSTTTVSRLLNTDGKTVARLVIERPAIGERALPPRLSIAEVRGYQGQARRAARILAGTPGIRPGPARGNADRTLLDDALRATGRRPGDYSNKVNATISAGMPAATAVATVLIVLLDVLEANVDGVLRDIDTEFLHDLRVAVRRTRAAIKLLGDALSLPDEQLQWFAAEFKWLGDLTTPVRDLDVHLLGFGEMAGSLKAAREEDLEPFRAFLGERRAREFRTLTRGLRSPRFRQVTGDWRAALAAVLHDSGKGPEGRSRSGSSPKDVATAGGLARARTRQAFRKVATRGAAITPASPHESLHDLRKRCKELRYVLEFFASLHDRRAYDAVLGDLKRLQDCLGDFQDNEVQVEEIRALAAAMLDEKAAHAPTILAMGEITAGLAAGQEAARAVFEKRFAGFAGPEGKRHMAVLLRGPETAGAARETA